MPKKNKAKDFFCNLAYAFAAQSVSLLSSILMSLIVPKILGVTEYAFWQLFLFYITYVGFFHFGLNDGIYLRIGGKHYHNLNFSLLGSQFWLAVIGQSVLALGICGYAAFFEDTLQRRFVLFATAGYMILVNAVGYLGFIFQATNHTKKYSTAMIINNFFYILCVLSLLIFREKHFQIYVILYLVAKLITLLYCMIIGRDIIFSPLLKLSIVLKEMYINIAVGINLLISNIASLLILGSGRFVIDRMWGIDAFGKFSFALSLTNFFLLFVSQISVVLFPALRQTRRESIYKFYHNVRDGLGFLLPAILLLYLPIKYLLGLWLPQYQESLRFLALLLPICTFDGKMQMLCNTYLKVLRKEKVILLINLFSVMLSVVSSLFGAFVIKSIYAVVVSMVFVVAFRSIIAEIYLAKLMNNNIAKNLFGECLLVIVFVTFTWFTKQILAFCIYSFVYACFIFLSRKKVTTAIASGKGILKMLRN